MREIALDRLVSGHVDYAKLGKYSQGIQVVPLTNEFTVAESRAVTDVRIHFIAAGRDASPIARMRTPEGELRNCAFSVHVDILDTSPV